MSPSRPQPVDSQRSRSLNDTRRQPARTLSDAIDVFVHRGYDPALWEESGSRVANRDIAVLRLDTGVAWSWPTQQTTNRWPNTSYRDYLNLYRDFGRWLEDDEEWLDVYGAGVNVIQGGTGAGTLRSTRFPIEDVLTYRILLDQTGAKGVCNGDSGGPWVVGGHDLIAGVVSGGYSPDGYPVPTCGNNGIIYPDNTFAARTVESNMDPLLDGANASCGTFHNGTYKYVSCYNVPFINDIPERGLARGVATGIVMAIL